MQSNGFTSNVNIISQRQHRKPRLATLRPSARCRHRVQKFCICISDPRLSSFMAPLSPTGTPAVRCVGMKLTTAPDLAAVISLQAVIYT